MEIFGPHGSHHCDRDYLLQILRYREPIGDAIIIGTGLVFTFFYWEFLAYGKTYAFEPNKLVAGVELVMSIFIIIFGIERLYRDYLQAKGSE